MKPDNGFQKRMIVMILKCHVKGFQNDCANLFIHSNSIVRILCYCHQNTIVKSIRRNHYNI